LTHLPEKDFDLEGNFSFLDPLIMRTSKIPLQPMINQLGRKDFIFVQRPTNEVTFSRER
jgi:hypothetical protein